jgi:hypothetical protein
MSDLLREKFHQLAWAAGSMSNAILLPDRAIEPGRTAHSALDSLHRVLKHLRGRTARGRTNAEGSAQILAIATLLDREGREAKELSRLLEGVNPAEVANHLLRAALHAEKAQQAEEARQGTSANAPTSTKPPKTCTPADVLNMTGVSATTLNEYAKRAKVKTPGRGQRNYRYSADDVRAILQAIIDKTSDSAMKQRCLNAIAKL